MGFISLILSWLITALGLFGILFGIFGFIDPTSGVPLLGLSPIVMLLIGLVLVLFGVWLFGRYAWSNARA